jgi:hypothetical protein
MKKIFFSVVSVMSVICCFAQAQESVCSVGCNASYCEVSAKIITYDTEKLLLTIEFDCSSCSGEKPVFAGMFIKENIYGSTCRYNFIVDVGRDITTRKSACTFSLYGCGVEKGSHTVSNFTIEEMAAVRMSGDIFYKDSKVKLTPYSNNTQSVISDYRLKREAQVILEAFVQGYDAVAPYLMTNYDCQQIKATKLMYLLVRNQKEAEEATEYLPKDLQFADFIFSEINIDNVSHLIGFVVASTSEGISMLNVRRHIIGRPLLFAKVEDEWKLYWVAKHWYFVDFDKNNTVFATAGSDTYNVSELIQELTNEIKDLMSE